MERLPRLHAPLTIQGAVVVAGSGIVPGIHALGTPGSTPREKTIKNNVVVARMDFMRSPV